MHTPSAERFAEQQGWRRRFVRTNAVALHCVEAGDPIAQRVVVLLHGFPEFWYAWRRQIQPLADAGLRVLAPDLRGYNLSDKPPRVRDYTIAQLVGDIAGLIRNTGGSRVTLVGHDWGGIIAWHVAMRHPQLLHRLAILNAPHPTAFQRELRQRPSQWLRSAYVLFFQLPWLPEALLRAGDWHVLRRMLRVDPVVPYAFRRQDVTRYVTAFARPRALASTLNYYRALSRKPDEMFRAQRIDVPTLVLWGEQDRYLNSSLTDDLYLWVPSVRMERLPDASHWLHHERPARVTARLLEWMQ
ncbi:MAG TPA: alpha/beta fold hydrolase [Tepidisphaeraceae bacterium]|jgi:pimeloyl-ACP methyl ester carboxylesterase|nr:alpha/beta fold hydrolase [Tepidisphaeraceae bacterium]